MVGACLNRNREKIRRTGAMIVSFEMIEAVRKRMSGSFY